ncbi:ALS_1a_G0048050.mRNA.1.CDS.1 [Saccharomyces cerevisiae]|nr:Bud17p [Saccharomyces cerevisiae YJM681]AJT19033.1 Bud17p [Saccharomyces cerevisiae YJM1304]KOH48413.1 BUD17p putative pyridoxal kinase [Saccharomyces boulardii (nom. inval.)]CAI4724869.1 AHG_G0046970.mRNA.1.CDS.1 [Saccharomyces cerevisiae]KQC41328.1 putative pyridoxal kinase [Saccharomyces boulardii (nom. inval.)]
MTSTLHTTKKVLSIQSHVIHGYVGNKAATFPLQYRGWDVDVLNTVQFSNHSGYAHFTGFKCSTEELVDIVEKGLIGSLRIKYDAVLSGYLPNVQALQKVAGIVGQLCEGNENVKWILDPVLGDNGRLYVDRECVAVYQDILQNFKIFLATPNQFEMELLVGMSIRTLDDAKQAFKLFHKKYPRVSRIVVTSLELSEFLSNDTYVVAGFDCSASEEIFFYEIPKINAKFSGSGDLISAMLTDSLLGDRRCTQLSLSASLGQVLWLVTSILQKTYDLNIAERGPQDSTIDIKDLKLIQCRDILKQDLIPSIGKPKTIKI